MLRLSLSAKSLITPSPISVKEQFFLGVSGLGDAKFGYAYMKNTIFGVKLCYFYVAIPVML